MRPCHAVRTVTVLAILFAIPAPALAQTAHEHAQRDRVGPFSEAQEREMHARTKAATAADAEAAAEAEVGTVADLGSWSAPVEWPVLGIHVALLPNGNVLAYDSSTEQSPDVELVHDKTRVTMWDPVTGSHQAVHVNGFNLFCSGLGHLLDGSVFTAGGNKDNHLDGIVQTFTFGASDLAWTRGPDMEYERWYPTVTAMPNGEMLIASGFPLVPEVRKTDGTLRTLTTASESLPLYPWLHVSPTDGRAFHAGPDIYMRKLDTNGTGSWQYVGDRDSIDRDYGSHAMYDVGKILVAGGGPSVADSRVIDINGSTPSVTATSPMTSGRRQHTLTVLADGTVLATGGNSSGANLVDLENGVYTPELWNPVTGTWRTLAAQRVTRQYHSTAMLLADGRVLSSGGGMCSDCTPVGYHAKDAEVFTPPYLYKKDGSGELAPRPQIASAPTTVGYGAPLQIETPDAGSISKVALVRPGAVTHSTDMDQRYVPLAFTTGGTTVSATTPANPNIAPPGTYMLFIIDSAGVPSVARMVTVTPTAATPPTITLTQPADGATFSAPADIAIAADAADSDGTVTKVEFFSGTTKLGEDTTAPYTHTWSGVAAGTYTISARATDNEGRSTTSTAATVTVRSNNVAPTVRITSPADGATFGWKEPIVIDADASDSDGSVTKVEFYGGSDGTIKIGEDATAPYSYTWTKSKMGTNVLVARATDDAGAVTASAGVTITVNRR